MFNKFGKIFIGRPQGQQGNQQQGNYPHGQYGQHNFYPPGPPIYYGDLLIFHTLKINYYQFESHYKISLGARAGRNNGLRDA